MAYKVKKSKVFDISSDKGIKRAERYQQRLYKEYDIVQITPFGLDKVKLAGIQ